MNQHPPVHHPSTGWDFFFCPCANQGHCQVDFIFFPFLSPDFSFCFGFFFPANHPVFFFRFETSPPPPPTHLLPPTYPRPIYLSTYPPIYLPTFSSYNRIQKSLNRIDVTEPNSWNQNQVCINQYRIYGIEIGFVLTKTQI